MIEKVATFDEAKARLLANLDRAYASVRAIAADDGHLNARSKEAESAREQFSEIFDDTFDLKNVRYNANKLLP